MADVNVIEWHIHPFRAERWYEAWKPALDRAPGFGATNCTLTRAEDDPLHFRQTSTWESRDDFAAWWASDEVAAARQTALPYFNKPLYPAWHTLVGVE